MGQRLEKNAGVSQLALQHLQFRPLSNNVMMGLLLTVAENSTADLLAIYRLDSEATKG